MTDPPQRSLHNVVSYGGHRIYAADDPEVLLAREMDELLERLSVGVATGSLACGADILWSEALSRRGAELHLFIAGSDEEFVEESVAPGGWSWVPRYEAMLKIATVTRLRRGEDSWEQSFRKTTEAMFAAAIQAARQLDAQVSLVSVWDGTESTQNVGTASDIATWRQLGFPVHLIKSEGRRVQVTRQRPGFVVAE